jgi:hypothetical protein
VAHGMVLDASAPCDWHTAAGTVGGTRYRFSGKGLGASIGIVVDNFMVLPTGGYGRDMDSVQRVAKDRRTRQFGAAEVQFLTDAAMPDARREEIFSELMGRIRPLLECVQQGSRRSIE